MKTIQWALLIFLQLGFVNAYSHQTMYDANAQVRNVGQFNAVVVSGSIDLFISQSATSAVAVSASDVKSIPQITTEVRNNTLYIGFNSKGGNWNAKDMKAYVSANILNKIEASGACDVKIEGELTVDNLEIGISGASDFKGRVVTQNLKIIGSGSSDFIISGKTANLKADVSGASDLKGYDLECDYCDIEASGASDVNITAHKEMSVQASGASDVSYKGEAQLKKVSSSGASDVKKKGR